MAMRPDIIVVSPNYGAEIVAASLAQLPEYEKTAEIPVDFAKDYGGYGATVYARRGSPALAAPPAPSLKEEK